MATPGPSEALQRIGQAILPYIKIYNVIILTVVANLCYYSFTRWRSYQRDEAFGDEHGCQPMHMATSWWPFSVNFIYNVYKADQEQRVLPYFCSLFEKRGKTFGIFVLRSEECNTTEPINVDAVLNTKFTDYWFGPNRVDNFVPFFGSGIFTQDGPAWKHSRGLLRPQFMHNRTFYYTHIQEQARRMNSLIEHEALKGTSTTTKCLKLDLEPVFFRLTLDTTTSMLFGKPISAYDDQQAVEAFVTAFTEGQEEVVKHFRFGPVASLLPKAKLNECTQICHDFVDGVVAEARKRDKANPSSEADHDNLLDSLLHLYPNDDVAVRSQLLNILLAGRDTTACLLTWCFRLLSLHPRVLQRLYEEVDRLPDLQSLDRQDFHNSNVPYLNAVLKEVLRLYPSVPANQRMALNRTILPVGGGPDQKSPVLIRKGTRVSWSPYVMGRRKDLWGEDANMFRPERWLENGGELEKSVGLAYVPFNYGPRVCLGQDMAMLEATSGVVHILKSWRGGMELMIDGGLTESGETGTEKQHCDIMIRPVGGCPVTLYRA